MPRTRNNLSQEQAQEEYDSKMKNFVNGKGDLQYVENLMEAYQNQSTLESTQPPQKTIKRGKLLIEKIKLWEKIRRFNNFVKKYEKKGISFQKEPENQEKLDTYLKSIDFNEEFRDQQEKNYIMKAAKEQITIDKGRNMERYRLRQQGKLKTWVTLLE